MSAPNGSRVRLFAGRHRQLSPAAARGRGNFARREPGSGWSAAPCLRLAVGARTATLLSVVLIPLLTVSIAAAAADDPSALRSCKGAQVPAGGDQQGVEAAVGDRDGTGALEDCGASTGLGDFSPAEPPAPRSFARASFKGDDGAPPASDLAAPPAAPRTARPAPDASSPAAAAPAPAGRLAQAEAPAAEPRYRVVGVEPDDVLNVRAAAGVSNRIVGTLPPDATGVALSGRERRVGGGTWVEIEDPSLPGGSGWVNARFLAPQTEPRGQTAAAEPGSRSVGDLAARFTDIQGYQGRDPEELVRALRAMLPADAGSVFHPDSEIGPLAKAILLLEANEGVLPRVRYRLRYGMATADAPPAAEPLPMSFVQVDRFNLGPRIREEAARSAGAGRAGPAEAFGTGPHVSYRLAMRPIQGQAADLVAAARAEIPGATAEDMTCLSASCLSLEPVGESTAAWGEMQEVALDFAPAYEVARGGVLSPAAAIDLAARALGAAEVSGDRLVWSGFEARESVAPMEPFAAAVIDVNLAQDAGLDAAFREGELMDDSLSAVWQRIAALPGAPGASPQVFGAQALECRRGAAFAAPGELCP